MTEDEADALAGRAKTVAGSKDAFTTVLRPLL